MIKVKILAILAIASTSLTMYSCKKENFSNSGKSSIPLARTTIYGDVFNDNGALHFGCADDFINIDDQLLQAEINNLDTTSDEPSLVAFENVLGFFSLRQKVREDANIYEAKELLMNISEDESDANESNYPDEKEIIQDPFLRTFLNPMREVYIGQSYFKFFSSLEVVEVINSDTEIISMIQTAGNLETIPAEARNNPYVVFHDLRFRGEPEIKVRELPNGKTLLIAPIPSACNIQWEINGDIVHEGDPYVIIQEQGYTSTKVQVTVNNEVIKKRVTTSAGLCDVYQEEIEIRGLSLSLGENCGEVHIEYNLGTFSTAPVQKATLDFGDGQFEDLDPSSSNNLIKHTYLDGQPRIIKLQILRGPNASNIVCTATDEGEIEPSVSDCCMTTGSTPWTWKKNGKYKMRYKYIIGTTLIRKRTKYLVKGRYKKGITRRKGSFNSRIHGEVLLELGEITCGELKPDYNKNPGWISKRWYTQKETTPYEDGLVIRYNHYEESLAFRLEAKGKGGSVGEVVKYLPKD